MSEYSVLSMQVKVNSKCSIRNIFLFVELILNILHRSAADVLILDSRPDYCLDKSNNCLVCKNVKIVRNVRNHSD